MGGQCGSTHVVGVSGRVIDPIGPVDNTLGLLSEQMFISSAVDVLNLVAGEDESLNRPVTMLDVVDLRCDGSDNSKVMTGSFHSPPEIRVLVNRLGGSVGEDNVHGDELIGNIAVLSLEPSVAASQRRSHVTDTFTRSSNYRYQFTVSV